VKFIEDCAWEGRLHLRIHTIAGATLRGTCVTSIGGVLFYPRVGPYFASPGQMVSPDWLLGALFGIGGFVGMYLGASVHKYVPGAIIRPILAIIITAVGLRCDWLFSLIPKP
jgi:uncharacterized protein